LLVLTLKCGISQTLVLKMPLQNTGICRHFWSNLSQKSQKGLRRTQKWPKSVKKGSQKPKMANLGSPKCQNRDFEDPQNQDHGFLRNRCGHMVDIFTPGVHFDRFCHICKSEMVKIVIFQKSPYSA
jgi:hypothetical protein